MADARPHVVLIGLMGVGKTTVGRRLAKELDLPFVDADEAIELDAGATIRTIFSEQGEAAFRERERRVIGSVLARDEPIVMSAGGGAVLDEVTRATLAQRATTVWLRASVRFLASRVDGEHRPLLAGGDVETTLRRLADERGPLYDETADVIVDVEQFHFGDEKPKRALARHLAGVLRDRRAATA